MWDKDRIEKVTTCTVTYRRIGRSCGWLWGNKKAETRKCKLWVSDKGDLASNTIQIGGDSAGDTLAQETWSSVSTFYMWLTSVMTWVGLLVLTYGHIPSLGSWFSCCCSSPWLPTEDGKSHKSHAENWSEVLYLVTYGNVRLTRVMAMSDA